jgi:hypothetical protein
MNFKPGYSVGFEHYPRTGDHEVRERDYFFVVSYVVWGLWAGMGLGTLVRTILERWRVPPLVGAGLLAFSLLPFAGNFTAASRRHGPDARLAADFAYDLLNTVPPYGVLFTYGDNDTFPLWWAQEVEGVRRDVTVVCLALAQTDWYMRQLRDNPIRSFEESRAPAIWQGRNPKEPDWPAHTLTNEQIGGIRPVALPQDLTIPIGAITKHYPSGTVFMTNDLLVMRVLQQNLGRRPIVWAMTTGRDYQGLDSYVVQQGLGFRLEQALPDSTSPDIDRGRILGAVIDVPMTDRLLWETYRYGKMAEPHDETALEPTSAGIANNLGLPFAQVANAYENRGDLDRAVKNLERASVISTNPAINEALSQLLLERARDSTPGGRK